MSVSLRLTLMLSRSTTNTFYCCLVGWAVLLSGVSVAHGAALEDFARLGEEQPAMLDAYQDALAAYGLVRLSTAYTGPALRVRRGSDGSEMDIGFAADGELDIAQMASWLSGADGYVVRWYSQIKGEPDLVQNDASRQPRIAAAGSVTRDGTGRAAIKFDSDRTTYLDPEQSFSRSYALHNMMAMMVGEVTGSANQHVVSFQTPDQWSHYALSVRLAQGSFMVRGELIESIQYNAFSREPSMWIINTDDLRLYTLSNNYDTGSKAIVERMTKSTLRIGAGSKAENDGFDGYFSAFLLYPGQSSMTAVQDRYDVLNNAFKVGPTGYNRDALLPQNDQWQIDIYNWLESIRVADVALSALEINWDADNVDVDIMADAWLQLEGASASRVVTGEPEWYVLDAGNGKGIEATGEVRIWHEPEKGHGNPPRSWSNEPAFLYQLSLPQSNGGEGNPYHQHRPLGLRALVVAAVDMLMYSEVEDAYAQWTDMHGKALLGWAETYRWTKRELPDDVRQAFEKGFEVFLDRILANGARGVNTNMDMFAVQGAAEIYMAADDPGLRTKAIQSVRRVLFGYPDGAVGGKHDTWASTKAEPRGVYSPAGYIMEGGQPDIFYQGESMYHLTGALAALTDRETGALEPGWDFLRTVVQQMETWFVYQGFSDPSSTNERGVSSAKYYHGGTGFAGRTGASFPAGQANFAWRNLALADFFEIGRTRLYTASGGHLSKPESRILPTPQEMRNAIYSRLASLEKALGSTVEGTPKEWNGWSPWTKPTPYLPKKGWYSRLADLINGNDPSVALPIDRDNHYYSLAFGGPPLGPEYWAYKDTDGSRDFGWYIEGQATQGPYGGWYGGKIETFWTSTTGVVLLNRHGKGGCDGEFEDSVCWDNLEVRAAHHVWGRDEDGHGFSPLHITDEDAHVRSSSFDLNGASPTVEVVNKFNAPGDEGEGEQSERALVGDVSITNRFQAKSNGLDVTHIISSDERDEIRELWLSLPIFLRSHRTGQWGHQSGLPNTTIEYRDGEEWHQMPEDGDGDGTPEFVHTTALRLGRDFLLGDGIQFAYILFEGAQRVRLASDTYSDPYQTRTLVRTVLVDLHGDPGTVRKMPHSKTLQYSIQTTQAAIVGNPGKALRQTIQLNPGKNLVARYVQPASSDLDVLLKDVSSCVILLKDEAGRVYAPAEGIDQIGDWQPGKAYEIIANEACSMSLTGEEMAQVTINLREGWNFIGYPFAQPQDVDDALATVADALVKMEDAAGNVYEPDKDKNTITELVPGRGYRVKVDRDVTLTLSAPN